MLYLLNIFNMHKCLEDLTFSKNLLSNENTFENIISLTEMKILLKFQSLQGIDMTPQLFDFPSVCTAKSSYLGPHARKGVKVYAAAQRPF